MKSVELQAGCPFPMGAHYNGEGVNFALFSEHASKVELCLFSADGKTELQRLELPERAGPVWHGFAPGMKPGDLYGYRVHGAYDPEHGHRFNPHKLLIDPYARELSGRWANHPATLGYEKKANLSDLSFSREDSAPYVPRSVVTEPHWDWAEDKRPRRSWGETLIYEAHPKGLTMQHAGVPEELRGTYEGMASDAMLEHLDKLGVTAIELLPVHQFPDDGFLIEKGMSNYWGYNSASFFALEPRYAGPSGAAGFRKMVRKFHAAGIEVLLDVVYNHTAEGNQLGPTMSFRGIDNASYYSLLAGQPRFYVNDAGCGNTLNVKNPYVLRMVLDSLRYWVEEMHVDGFRFDLATVLGREDHGFTQTGGFFDALRQDPVLSTVKMIAEPWDVGPGGYQLGNFPHEFGEWNDRYRDSVRKFWRGDAHSAQELAGCLLGSASEFDRNGRLPQSSINLLAAHDGFTLADTTAYNHKHNLANGEYNHDGHHSNFSDNCGVEGKTDDPEILEKRQLRQRNMLATLLFSQGTPMLLSGDEIGNSQQGNNNVYCQDNPIGWVSWPDADTDLLEFTRRLTKFRRDHPVLRQTRYLHSQLRIEDDLPDVEWTQFDGGPLNWRDPLLDSFCLLLRGAAEAPAYRSTDDKVILAVNSADTEAELSLPKLTKGRIWYREIDTAAPTAMARECNRAIQEIVAPHALVAFAAREA